jgi:hypothetical protein
MVNGRTPLYLTLAALGLLGAAMLAFQPHSADWPGTAYTKPAQRFIRAAIRRDSAGLVRLSASSAPVTWALHAARARPGALALWQRRVRAWTGELRGDTVEVFVYPPGEVCEDAPIVLRFVGTGRDLRVVEAGSSCLDR